MPKPRSRKNSASLKWATWFLFPLGLGLLGYVGYTQLDAKIFQMYESRKLDREVKAARIATSVPAVDPSPIAFPAFSIPVSLPSDDASQPGMATGEVVGRIEIN